MTIRQWAEKQLFDCGLFEPQAKAVVEQAIASPSNEAMKGRWDEPLDGYPPQLQGVLSLAIKTEAHAWLTANHPKHWALAVFAPFAANKTPTDSLAVVG